MIVKTTSSPHCLLAVMLFCGAAAGTQCPDGPLVIQAVQGSNATVEWCFSSNISISSLKIHCEKLVPEWRVFYHLYDTVNMAEQPPHQQFAGRVHCNKDALRTGCVRLHLSRVQMNDSGLYRCGMFTESDIKIKVFSLNITSERTQTWSRHGADMRNHTPEPPTPQPEAEPEPQPESSGSLGLYVGLAAAAAAAAGATALVFVSCHLYIQKPKLHQELQEVQTLQDIEQLQKPKVNNMVPLLKQDSSCEAAPQVIIKLPVGSSAGL